MFFIPAFIDNICFYGGSFGLLHDLLSPREIYRHKKLQKIAKPKSMVVCHKVATVA